ncbi:hypothetical protein TIFTF001_022471 [Ficus carica]|uniref:Uncharacterized protein n=1 Tax=Ficus carica TaxID=3494 RepID=A0AA88DK01_FICCA|nr:hypothetical protein TIFTF001_022471 [Ficus carica]
MEATGYGLVLKSGQGLGLDVLTRTRPRDTGRHVGNPQGFFEKVFAKGTKKKMVGSRKLLDHPFVN